MQKQERGSAMLVFFLKHLSLNKLLQCLRSTPIPVRLVVAKCMRANHV